MRKKDTLSLPKSPCQRVLFHRWISKHSKLILQLFLQDKQVWVNCAHRKEPLPLQNREVFYSRNPARRMHTHPATHWNQRTMMGALSLFFPLLPLWQKESGWRQTLWLHIHLKALSNARHVEQHGGSSFCLHFCVLTGREENFNWISSFPVVRHGSHGCSRSEVDAQPRTRAAMTQGSSSELGRVFMWMNS